MRPKLRRLLRCRPWPLLPLPELHGPTEPMHHGLLRKSVLKLPVPRRLHPRAERFPNVWREPRRLLQAGAKLCSSVCQAKSHGSSCKRCVFSFQRALEYEDADAASRSHNCSLLPCHARHAAPSCARRALPPWRTPTKLWAATRTLASLVWINRW